jgi:TonB-dependent starch-binding outer membrane protein SusC
MKLTLIFTMLVFLSFGKGFTQVNVTLQFEKTTIQELMETLEKQTGYVFLYKDEIFDPAKRYSVDFTDEPFEDVLQTVCEKAGVDFEIRSNRQIILTEKKKEAVDLDLKASQQEKTVTGVVTDHNGQPLPGVSVVVKGTTTGTVTNNTGEFFLAVPVTAEILQFSFVGMQTQDVAVEGRTTLTVVMDEEIIGMDEVVIIGYGSREKKDITTSISSLGVEDVTKSISMSPQMAMQGRMSGVYISGNGNVMQSPKVQIRGMNTWGNSTPLYVIDGVPVTGTENDIIIGSVINVLNLIDPNDIESISVLKDAAASSIYGVRASNGVVLITTKQGRGKTKINFNSRYGVQNIRQRLDVLNTRQYAEFGQKVFASDPTIAIDPLNIVFDPSSNKYLGNNPTYDWQEAILNKDAPTQDYSLSLSGSTDKTDYYASAGYQNAEGVYFGNYLKRYSGSLNLNSQINEFLKIGINYRLIYSEGFEGEIYKKARFSLMSAAGSPPWQPIYDENGPFGFAPVVNGITADGVYDGTQMYGTGTNINYMGQIEGDQTEQTSLRNLGFAYIELKPFKNFSVEGKISMDVFSQGYFDFRDSRTSVFIYTAGDPRAYGGGNSAGIQDETTIDSQNTVKEITLNYSNIFDDHTIDVLFNAMDQKYCRERRFITAEYNSTSLDYMRVYEGENKYSSINSELGRWALQGILARISYKFKSKYYLDLTTRRDGSARFAPENRWGVFPGVSAAWRISSEKFMDDLGWITDLKIRGSWGQLGNQEVRENAYLSVISTVPTFAWGENPASIGRGYFNYGAAVYGIPNIGLQWEKTTTTNLGFDAIVYDDLSFSFEYYNKLTDGILQEVSMPYSSGILDQMVDNIASVRNSGVEMSLNYRNSIGDIFYNISGNFSTTKNRVEETYKHIPLWDNLSIEEGYPMYYIRGYKFGGLFQNPGEVEDWKSKYTDVSYNTAKVGPGDAFFHDLRSSPNNENEFYSNEPDNQIDNYDQVYLGKTIPGYFYGFNFSLEYKKFDFSAQFVGVGDVDKYNGLKASFENTSTVGGNKTTNIFDAWTPENTNTSIPRIMYGNPSNAWRRSDKYVESAAYMRLSHLELGYTFPIGFYRWTNNNINHARIYGGAGNLFTLTKYSGLDPDNDYYPSAVSFFMGLNLIF